jgi:trehalose 6-phosphate synthase/phosphatase
MSRMIFVSNRLPVTVKINKKEVTYEKSIGGLATGLKSFHEQADALWVGWPGFASDRMKRSQLDEIQSSLLDNYHCFPVYLSERDVTLYYEGFSNRTIWPLFHYFPNLTEYDNTNWQRYKKVNLEFYQKLEPFIEEDSVIWIHDYQLMLLPELIKKNHPTVKIGFFLHIPFPSSEIFRLLVWKEEILKGILGADLIGFHTYDYVRHFLSSVRRILNVNHHFYKLFYNHRHIEIDAFPMGIDYHYFSTHQVYNPILTDPQEKMILSVDRLDYTKGIVERIKAFKAFLDKYPKYIGKVRLNLIVAPSRQSLPFYDQLRSEIEILVSQINGSYNNRDWMPIWYYFKSFSQDELIAYYKAADILLVTPLRDGMNLIAKEYIASRTDYLATLILSETAGAASELSEAIIINPNDEIQIANAIKDALEMSKKEKIQRNKIMHERIQRYNVNFWAKEFIERLDKVEFETQIKLPVEALVNKDELLKQYDESHKRIFFLDYDGTLSEFKKTPMQAAPSRALKSLLSKLIANPKHEVVIISGRDHETLDMWFGNMDVNLVGDHGLWYRKIGHQWKKTINIQSEWKKSIRHILEMYVDRMPGSFIEEKSHSIALHYRQAEPEMVSLKMSEIKDALYSIKGTTPIEIQQGNMVLEVKDQRVNKGNATRLFINDEDYDFILVAGDDTTDEDMFKALPEAFSIKIGFGETAALHRVQSDKDFRKILKELSERK